MITNITLIVGAYLFGSLAAAIILCKMLGLGDPRLEGSGNPGATNVMRLHGKKAGIIALLGDLLKGLIPVLLARYLGANDTIIALTALAAFIGHLFPVFFGFKGGKGVATLLGVLMATSWVAGLLFVITWLIVAMAFRYSSLASLTSALMMLVYVFVLLPDYSYLICFAIMAMLLLWRHRPNIRKLLAGTESKIGARS
jgi:acyl phosphate:glycerol-3-phosphate acyltransferase